MFSYRHAFHAGNHADVLKHIVLIATLDYLLEKDTPLTFVDTHAGAGLYRLDSDAASLSGEAAQGVGLLRTGAAPAGGWAPPIARYLELLDAFNPKGRELRIYPGSPFVADHLLRAEDRLKLCELHPTDARALSANIAQLDAGRRIAVDRADGFASATRYLPPPSRRGLVLCDPSYEIKTDYARVADFVREGLRRFATGTFMVWHPIIARPEAHGLPRRLRTIAEQAKRPWLSVSLTVKSARVPTHAGTAEGKRPGLPASGVFLLNPPFTLEATLRAALPQLVDKLKQDRHAGFLIQSSG